MMSVINAKFDSCILLIANQTVIGGLNLFMFQFIHLLNQAGTKQPLKALFFFFFLSNDRLKSTQWTLSSVQFSRSVVSYSSRPDGLQHSS